MSNYTKPDHVSKRVRFYDGQFLQDQDFIDEQNYHLDRQARIGRSLQVAGIVEGLEVTVTGEALSVSAGTAVDLQGHVLVLADSRTQFDQDGEVTIRPATEPFAIPIVSGQSEQHLYLAYCQVPVDLQQGKQGLQGETRWQEAPFLFLANELLGSDDAYERPPWDEYVATRPTPVLLTRLQIDANGQVEVTGPRVYSGLRLAGPGGGASWVMDEDGRVQLRNSQDIPLLSIIGNNLGIGTADPGAYKLNVSGGDTLLDGSLSVIGNVGIGTANPGDYKLNVSGGDTLMGGKLRFGSETRQMVDLWDTRYGIGVQGYTQYFRTIRNFAWYKDGSHDDDELQPGSGGTVQMVIKDGKVGIGTTTPQAALQVRPLTYTAGGWAEAIRLDHPNHAAITHPAGNLLFGMHGDNKMFYFADANIDENIFNKYLMTIDGTSGNVGIGAINASLKLEVNGGWLGSSDGSQVKDGWRLGRWPSYDANEWLYLCRANQTAYQNLAVGDLWVDGTLRATKDLFVTGKLAYYWAADGQWKHIQNLWNNVAASISTAGPSDIRLKRNIRPINHPLEKVLQLQGTLFEWDEHGLDYFTKDIPDSILAGPDATDDENQALWDREKKIVCSTLSGDNMGLIAQEVEAIVPEVVVENKDGYKHIRYQYLTALLIEAIKEQQVAIESIRNQIE